MTPEEKLHHWWNTEEPFGFDHPDTYEGFRKILLEAIESERALSIGRKIDARAAVPELSRRLNKACEILKEIHSSLYLNRHKNPIYSESFIEFIKKKIDELEAMPEGK